MFQTLVGEWEFLGSQMTDMEGRILSDSMNQASGVIIYTSTGYMGVQLAIPKSTSPIHNDWNINANYIAYHGRYAFDSKLQLVTHSVIGASIVDLIGQSFVRKVAFHQDGSISLKNIEAESIAIAVPIYRELFWKRLN